MSPLNAGVAPVNLLCNVKKKPTLVLYSGGQQRGNQLLHRELVRLARRETGQARGGSFKKPKEPLRFTYMPFCADGSMTYFMRSVRRYARHGIGEFCSLVADERPSRAQVRLALKAHVVYLAGGNTFYFLAALRKSGLLSFLRDYAESGGILAGLSAGAHILPPHIGLAGVPGLDPDPNDVRLRNLKSLGLAPFEILPHFTGSSRAASVLRAYSRDSRHPVYACPDGAGLVIENGAVRAMGRGIRLFSGGVEL
jgi:dipeptidase E